MKFHLVIVQGDTALVASEPDEDGVSVVAHLDVSDPAAPSVIEVTVTSRPLPGNYWRVQMFRPFTSDTPIRVADVRGVNMKAIENAALQGDNQIVVLHGTVEKFLDWCLDHAYGQGILALPDEYTFRLERDQAAAVRRVVAAYLYAFWTYSEDFEPVIGYVADDLELTESAARSLVAQARRAGFLTAGRPGKGGGNLTAEGMAFLKACLAAWKTHLRKEQRR